MKMIKKLKSILAFWQTPKDLILDAESRNLFESISPKDLDKYTKAGKTYFEGVELIRFHQKLLMKEYILNPIDDEFKDLDPRAMGYMLDRWFEQEAKILEILEELLERKK